MGKAPRKTTPTWKTPPKGDKQVKFGQTPESTDAQTIAWQFHRRDKAHHAWGWDKLGNDGLVGLIDQHLCHLETMTWGELLKAAGGRKNGNNHHQIDVAACCDEAQRRLQALHLDDIDQLFSLRLTGKWRLFGMKDGRVLRFLWCDQEHTVYPLKT